MTARANQTFHHSGGTVHGGTEYPLDHPYVAAFPGMFDVVGEVSEDESEPDKEAPATAPVTYNVEPAGQSDTRRKPSGQRSPVVS